MGVGQIISISYILGSRCNSVVRAFAHGAKCRRIDPSWWIWEGEFLFYLTTHSTHFIYGYMASDIWLRTILIMRKETRCRHIGRSYRLTARVLLYAPSHRQDNTYHGLCYTSCGVYSAISRSSQCSTTGLTKSVVCVILSVG